MAALPIADQITALQAQIAKLQAHKPPVFTFRATARKGAPLTYDFTIPKVEYADGAVFDNVQWDFGQSTYGSSSGLNAPGYVWQTSGVKTVRVTVTDSWGASSTQGAKITVSAPAPVPTPAPPAPTPVPTPPPVPQQGVTAYTDLAGATFSKRVNSAPAGNLVNLPAGTYEVADFADGQQGTAQGLSAYGAQLTGRGLVGPGATLQLTPRSSTKAAAVPPNGPGGAGNPTNNLYVLRVQTPKAAVQGLAIRGTDQGHLYNGLRFESVADPTLTDCLLDSIPGQGGSNPGETFAVNFQRATGKATVYRNVIRGGSGVLSSSAGLGLNSCSADFDIDGLVATDLTGSAPIAIWQQTGRVTVRGMVSRRNPRHLGAERLAAPVDIYDPIWDVPRIGHDVTYTPWAGYPLGSISFYFTDASKLLGRKIIVLTNDAKVKPTVHVFVDGVEQPQADHVTFQGA